MKIAIDTADLDCERIDGTRVYIQNVLKYLGELALEDEFFLLHKTEYNNLLRLAEFKNYQDKSLGRGFWWTQIKFAREVRKLNSDVCWMPIQQIPFLQSIKSKVNPTSLKLRGTRSQRSIKYVVTIHDLAFKFFLDHFPLIDRLKINFYTDVAVKRADRIIAISESTKRDLIRLYPEINENKIVVVHHGFDRENFEQEFREEEKVQFLKKWKLDYNKDHQNKINLRNGKIKQQFPTSPNRLCGTSANGGYLLYVGAIQPRKDLVTLIRAFNMLKQSQIMDVSDLKLVLVGERAWKSESTLREIERSEFKNDIIVTGKVDFKELAMFFRWAKVFVFPSLYEGFGIPILEAMASKTPVVVADNSSLLEVGGEAVLKFKTGNSDDLEEQLRKLLGNKDLQDKMVEQGLEQIKKFSWEKCAKETLEVLKGI